MIGSLVLCYWNWHAASEDTYVMSDRFLPSFWFYCICFTSATYPKLILLLFMGRANKNFPEQYCFNQPLKLTNKMLYLPPQSCHAIRTFFFFFFLLQWDISVLGKFLRFFIEFEKISTNLKSNSFWVKKNCRMRKSTQQTSSYF